MSYTESSSDYTMNLCLPDHKVLQKLMNHLPTSDLMIKVGDRIYYVHTIVFHDQSMPVVAASWVPAMKEMSKKTVDMSYTTNCVPLVTDKVFELYLYYCYGFEVNVSGEQLCGLVCLADHLQDIEMIQILEAQLSNRISIDIGRVRFRPPVDLKTALFSTTDDVSLSSITRITSLNVSLVESYAIAVFVTRNLDISDLFSKLLYKSLRNEKPPKLSQLRYYRFPKEWKPIEMHSYADCGLFNTIEFCRQMLDSDKRELLMISLEHIIRRTVFAKPMRECDAKHLFRELTSIETISDWTLCEPYSIQNPEKDELPGGDRFYASRDVHASGGHPCPLRTPIPSGRERHGLPVHNFLEYQIKPPPPLEQQKIYMQYTDYRTARRTMTVEEHSAFMQKLTPLCIAPYGLTDNAEIIETWRRNSLIPVSTIITTCPQTMYYYQHMNVPLLLTSNPEEWLRYAYEVAEKPQLMNTVLQEMKTHGKPIESFIMVKWFINTKAFIWVPYTELLSIHVREARTPHLDLMPLYRQRLALITGGVLAPGSWPEGAVVTGNAVALCLLSDPFSDESIKWRRYSIIWDRIVVRVLFSGPSSAAAMARWVGGLLAEQVGRARYASDDGCGNGPMRVLSNCPEDSPHCVRLEGGPLAKNVSMLCLHIGDTHPAVHCLFDVTDAFCIYDDGSSVFVAPNMFGLLTGRVKWHEGQNVVN